MNQEKGGLSLNQLLSCFSATPEREILWACENGKQSIIENILEHHPEAINATDSDGYTPLHRAAYSDHVEIVKVKLHCLEYCDIPVGDANSF